MNAFSGILLALIGRSNTGRGQHVDIGMQEGQLSLHTYLASAWLNAGIEPPVMETDTFRSPRTVPMRQPMVGLILLLRMRSSGDYFVVHSTTKSGRPTQDFLPMLIG